MWLVGRVHVEGDVERAIVADVQRLGELNPVVLGTGHDRPGRSHDVAVGRGYGVEKAIHGIGATCRSVLVRLTDCVDGHASGELYSGNDDTPGIGATRVEDALGDGLTCQFTRSRNRHARDRTVVELHVEIIVARILGNTKGATAKGHDLVYGDVISQR